MKPFDLDLLRNDSECGETVRKWFMGRVQQAIEKDSKAQAPGFKSINLKRVFRVTREKQAFYFNNMTGVTQGMMERIVGKPGKKVDQLVTGMKFPARLANALRSVYNSTQGQRFIDPSMARGQREVVIVPLKS